MRAKRKGIGSGIEYIPTQLTPNPTNPANGGTSTVTVAATAPSSLSPLVDGDVEMAYWGMNIATVKESDTGTTYTLTTNSIQVGSQLSVSGTGGSRSLTITLASGTLGYLVVIAYGDGGSAVTTIKVGSNV